MTVLYMHLPAQNILAWEICITFLHHVVIGSTFLRLLYRWRTNRMWWDDYTAIIPLVVDVAYVIFMWWNFGGGRAGHKLEGLIYSALFAAICWTIIWGSRFSLSLSIARIFPEKHPCRRVAFLLSFAVSLSYVSYVTSVLVIALTCKLNDSYDLHFNCLEGRVSPGHLAIFVCAVLLDFTAELLMIVTPLVMLWRVKLPTKERRLILALFASNLISMLSLIVFGTVWFFVRGPDSAVLLSMFALFQAAISLLICNLLIVTMLVYRILRKTEENVRTPGLSSSPVTGHQASFSSLAIPGDDHNSTADWKSSDHPLTTAVSFTTTTYNTLSRISPIAPTSAPALRIPGSMTPSYFTQEGDIASSSQLTGPPWSVTSSEIS